MNSVKGCRYGMMIYNSLDVWQGHSFEIYGEYSESECELFKRLIKPDDIVMDVGANIGSHTLCFARLVGNNGIVASFEPERTAFNTLCGNISINSFRHVYPFQCALSDTTGTIQVPELGMDVQNWGGIELENPINGASYPVSTNKMDNILVPRLNFVKIDVEGMEDKVIKGGKETIEKYRPYLYVENDRPTKIHLLNQLITSLEYDIYLHRAPFYNPNNFNGIKKNHFAHADGRQVISENVLCIPKEKPIDFNMDGIPGFYPQKVVVEPLQD